MKTLNIFLLILLIFSITVSAEIPDVPSNDGKTSIKDYTSNIWTSFTSFQRDLQSKLTKAMKELKESMNIKILMLIILISIFYGIVHALGPGHGKMLISSYYLNRESKTLSALKIGFVVAFTHSGLALIIGLIFGLLLKGTGLESRENVQSLLSLSSGILIMLLGLLYILLNVKSIKAKLDKFYQNTSNDYLIGIFSGMVPCPVSMTIILFSIYMKILWIGIISVLSLSIGMALTVALIGVIVIRMKESILDKVSNNSINKKIHRVVSVLGALLIFLIGLLLVINSI